MVRCARETRNGEGIEPESTGLEAPLLGVLGPVLGPAGVWRACSRRRMIVERLGRRCR